MNRRITSCLIASILAGTALNAENCNIKNIDEGANRPAIWVEVWGPTVNDFGQLWGPVLKHSFYLKPGHDVTFDLGRGIEFFLTGTEFDVAKGETLLRSDICDMDCTGGHFWLTWRWNFEVTSQGKNPGVNTSTFWRNDKYGGGCPN